MVSKKVLGGIAAALLLTVGGSWYYAAQQFEKTVLKWEDSFKDLKNPSAQKVTIHKYLFKIEIEKPELLINLASIPSEEREKFGLQETLTLKSANTLRLCYTPILHKVYIKVPDLIYQVGSGETSKTFISSAEEEAFVVELGNMKALQTPDVVQAIMDGAISKIFHEAKKYKFTQQGEATPLIEGKLISFSLALNPEAKDIKLATSFQLENVDFSGLKQWGNIGQLLAATGTENQQGQLNITLRKEALEKSFKENAWSKLIQENMMPQDYLAWAKEFLPFIRLDGQNKSGSLYANSDYTFDLEVDFPEGKFKAMTDGNLGFTERLQDYFNTLFKVSLESETDPKVIEASSQAGAALAKILVKFSPWQPSLKMEGHWKEQDVKLDRVFLNLKTQPLTLKVEGKGDDKYSINLSYQNADEVSNAVIDVVESANGLLSPDQKMLLPLMKPLAPKILKKVSRAREGEANVQEIEMLISSNESATLNGQPAEKVLGMVFEELIGIKTS